MVTFTSACSYSCYTKITAWEAKSYLDTIKSHMVTKSEQKYVASYALVNMKTYRLATTLI